MRRSRHEHRRIAVNVTLDLGLLDRVDEEANRREETRSAFMREALRFWFDPEAEKLREEPSLLRQE